MKFKIAGFVFKKLKDLHSCKSFMARLRAIISSAAPAEKRS